MIQTGQWEGEIVKLIYELLLTVIIIELFETVTVYIRTKKVPVRAILIAGLTAMIRHVIVVNLSEVEPFYVIGPAMLMAVLIAGIYLLKDDIHIADIKG